LRRGNRGTDHLHGSVYWALGGGLKGGRIVGGQVKVDEAHLFQNRDYLVLTDYRALRRPIPASIPARQERTATRPLIRGAERFGAGLKLLRSDLNSQGLVNGVQFLRVFKV
jgi:hypothetical protein